MQFELTKDFLEQIENAINNKEDGFLLESLFDLHVADLNLILVELSTDQCKYLLTILGTEKSAEVVAELDSDIRVKFLKSFEPADVAVLLPYLDSDDAADLLNEQTLKTREEVLSLVDDQEVVEHLHELLRYEEDCAGGMMGKELVKADINWTVSQCIQEIKRQAENVDKLYSIYVVNDKDKLLGRVSIKKILLAPKQTQIADLYEEDLISVDVFTEEQQIAQIMSKYDLDAVPVVNLQGKLVGRITIDDIIDVITEQAETERNLMAGISENVEQSDSVWNLTRARLPWLLIGVLGGLLSAMLLGVFEDPLSKYTAVAFFIPLITATGGNVGIQSSSIVVQSLANKSAFDDTVTAQLFKSFIVSLLNGVAIFVLVIIFTYAYQRDYNLSLVVGTAIFSVVILSSMMGTVTPLVLEKFDVNPAIASGPFITTANDILGIAIYFSIVKLLIINVAL
jgi:magnesium transporter